MEYNVGTSQGYELLTPFELLAELKKRSSITFVDKLQAVYTVAGQTVNVDQEIVLEDERFVSIRASSNVELRDRLSVALASLVTEEPVVQRPLADSIFRLLTSRSPKDMERYLKGRGIPWEFDAGSESEHWEDNSMEPDIDQGEEEVNDRVARMLSESIVPRSPHGSGEPDRQGSASIHSRNGVRTEPKQRSLPPIAEVAVKQILRDGTVHARQPQQTRTSGSSSGWSPPTWEQEEWDRKIGRRGEKLVYRSELERVKKLGYPESRVEWISEDNPGADHDIRSVGCHGEDLFIEVKSTTGKDGRFQWSKNEFDLARSLRDRYVLYRVYEVDSKTPSMKPFQDPVGLLLQNALRLDISSLYAEVESL